MKRTHPSVSIIIPCRAIDDYTVKCVAECRKLDYSDFEIWILPDALPSLQDKKRVMGKNVKIIPTGKVKPSLKRNLAMKKSKADLFAFIDSDAYPVKNWLAEAAARLRNPDIAMVGGPNLTPPEAGFREKVSGIILSKWLCSGNASIRYMMAKEQEVWELPSCNFIVKREYAGTFQSDLLTAEDSKFCFDILKKGKKILYVPGILVYHHRREIFRPHIRQMWIYGRDIGLLLKKKGEFSWEKMYYALLSTFVIGVIGGFFLSFISPVLKMMYVLSLAFYFSLMLLASISRSMKTTLCVFLGIVATHIAYGTGFVYGLLSRPKNQLNLR